MTVTDFQSKMAAVTHVQRHPTIPMTKRDSMGMSGSRVSLISTGSICNTNKTEEKDYVTNTHPEMVTGKKRTPKKVKRTDSYKKALNRQSASDILDGVVELGVTDQSRAVDRQKYNTLPLKTAQTTCNSEQQRKKRPSGSKDKSETIHRSASQKSGTYPSPDTDEDQRATQPERKKKSGFKRFKERLISTIRRGRDDPSEKKQMKKMVRGSQNSSVRVHVRPHHHQSVSGFQTPNGNSAKQQSVGNGQNSKPLEDRLQTLTVENNNEMVVGRGSDKGQVKDNRNIFKNIRESFRRKQAPQKYLPPKKDPPERKTSSSEVNPPPNGRHSPPAQAAPVDQPYITENPENIDFIDDDEEIFEGEDNITAIFGSIIDPPLKPLRYASLCTARGARAPDRAKLRLEGLHKCRPKSFDVTDGPAGQSRSLELSPTVEVDGVDFPDEVDAQLQRRRVDIEELSFVEVSEQEQQRRIDDVAKCLAALGDKIAAEKGFDSEASSSDLEGHRIGRSSLERSLITDLRNFADRELSMGQNGLNMSISFMPAIKSLIAAQDYSNFKTVIQRELSNTNGWEQVAWYTYLVKTAVCITESSVGTVVKNRAKKYFNSVFRPWIESRPNGWESIHEETDIDSELD